MSRANRRKEKISTKCLRHKKWIHSASHPPVSHRNFGLVNINSWLFRISKSFHQKDGGPLRKFSDARCCNKQSTVCCVMLDKENPNITQSCSCLVRSSITCWRECPPDQTNPPDNNYLLYANECTQLHTREHILASKPLVNSDTTAVRSVDMQTHKKKQYQDGERERIIVLWWRVMLELSLETTSDFSKRIK